jgi:hypothetical protein
VGRFFAVDPLFKSYPYNSTYAFSENKVIEFVELEGLEVGLSSVISYAKAGVFGKPVQQVVNGIDKSVGKSVDGLIYVASNPKEALKGTGNFLLGATVKSTGLPSSLTSPILQNIDQKFGTTTLASTQAFEQSISESANKLINGDLEDKTEVITDMLTAYFGDKGVGKLKMLKRFSLAESFYKKYGGKVSHTNGINFVNKVFTKTFNEKSSLYQWTINGKLGDYFTDSPSSKNLGLPQMPDGTPAYWDDVAKGYKARTLVKVELPEGSSVKGLQSTASTVDSWDHPGGKNIGGDSQIYAPEVKNINPTTIKQ